MRTLKNKLRASAGQQLACYDDVERRGRRRIHRRIFGLDVLDERRDLNFGNGFNVQEINSDVENRGGVKYISILDIAHRCQAN